MEQNNHFSKNEKKQLSSSLLIRKNENYELYGENRYRYSKREI